ncbi:hypothetical protein OCV51_14250 [Faecalicatena acetigenes]|uniref:Uncharacterized protein n=1 Tax=Faecalicatena acetigenes TaxID=2981790 RepID=A0ABT2TGJ7_9FIRM|nr:MULTISPECIES: hypothetical protein [Lachnospiraceae]MCU6748794.1 hypothetical protein [Faecalicatena acetigenes]SCI65923.1 CD20-like family [uncultured Clostridium sp.]
MKCPICQKEVEIQKKQVGVNENNDPIFNEYAICRNCKKQWNLDKQRAKKAAKKAAGTKEQPLKPGVQNQTANVERQKQTADHKPANLNTQKSTAKKNGNSSANTAVSPEKTTELKKVSAERAQAKKTGRPTAAGTQVKTRSPKQAPADKPVKRTGQGQPAKHTRSTAPAEEQKYANIPPERIRTKRETAVKKGYEDMLATDPGRRPVKKRRTAPSENTTYKNSAKSAPAARRKPEPPVVEEDMYEEETPRFRSVKIIFGVLSLIGFAFFTYKAFTTGLTDVTAGNESSAGTIYIILALCLLLSGILLFILQKKNTFCAFLFPAVFCIGGAVFAFLKRNTDSMLLYCAVGCAVFAVIFIILTIASLGSGDSYDEEDYDDPFEDDYDNY